MCTSSEMYLENHSTISYSKEVRTAIIHAHEPGIGIQFSYTDTENQKIKFSLSLPYGRTSIAMTYPYKHKESTVRMDILQPIVPNPRDEDEPAYIKLMDICTERKISVIHIRKQNSPPYGTRRIVNNKVTLLQLRQHYF